MFRIFCLFLLVSSAYGQTFPAKPVKILSPFPTGITPDTAARLVADRLSKIWGQPVIVEPRPGANGFIAIAAPARLQSQPDVPTVAEVVKRAGVQPE